jgi:hypothetical protein
VLALSAHFADPSTKKKPMTNDAHRMTFGRLAILGGIAVGVIAVVQGHGNMAVSQVTSRHPAAARMIASADWKTYPRQCQQQIYAALTDPQLEKMVAEDKKEPAMGYVAAQLSFDCLAELRK